MLERQGLEEGKCAIVRAALKRFTNAATAIPDDSWWKRQIWRELQDFEEIYVQWNDVNGTLPENIRERNVRLKALRKKRNTIATKIRKNQYIIQNELDLQLVRDGYEALGDLTRALPDIFRNLAAAIARFNSGVEPNGKRQGPPERGR